MSVHSDNMKSFLSDLDEVFKRHNATLWMGFNEIEAGLENNPMRIVLNDGTNFIDSGTIQDGIDYVNNL